MKIRINNRVVDMPLRRFEFSPTAKESAGAVQSVRGADTAGGAKTNIKRPPDILHIKQQDEFCPLRARTYLGKIP